MKVLGIESSCDETSSSVVENGKNVLSVEVSSSLDFHREYGGIIPEIASRAQLETIQEVTSSALKKAGVTLKQIDLISVTNGPGLIGSLLVGISFAKALGLANNKPVIGINHIQAHLYPAFFQNNQTPNLPFIGLIVSGGHTSLYLVKSFNNYAVLGRTRDDACGEAFDKAAKIMGLGYPGGPEIEKLAKSGNPNKIKFNFPGLKDNLDFSFSGIKTALLYLTKNKSISTAEKRNLSASFQKAIVEVLAEKSFAALKKHKIKNLVLGGGVTINENLRSCFIKKFENSGIKVFMPPKRFCLDNAAMIAGLGYQLYRKSKKLYPPDLKLN